MFRGGLALIPKDCSTRCELNKHAVAVLTVEQVENVSVQSLGREEVANHLVKNKM